MTDKSEKNGLVPPYVSYKALMNFVETLRRGIPSQIDRSLMRNLSGSMQTQMLTALRYLKLINQQGHPEPNLSRLVNADGDGKAKVLEDIIRVAYPSLFNDFDLTKATSNQFRQKFVEAGSSGESIRKGIYFFLAAAKEANIDVSPYIAEPTPKQGDSKPLSWEQLLLAKFPNFDPGWPDEVKREWFAAFHQMMLMGKTAEVEAANDEEPEDVPEDE